MLNLRLKIREFFKKYGLIFIVALIGIMVILGVNYALKNGEIKTSTKENTVDSFVQPVIDTKNPISEGYKEEIEVLISNYIDLCNNKEYEKAYDILDDEFKSIYFKNIDRFKIYIDKLFKSRRMYNVQNISNINGVYVFSVKIMDDILATGTTGEYKTVEDKYVAKKVDGEFKISLNGYCGKENINIVSEDEFMKVEIISKTMTYEQEKYSINFTNKTSNYIILANEESQGEFALNVSGDIKVSNISDSNIVIMPNETTTKTISFDKYFDDNKNATELLFNAIRVLPQYSGNSEKIDQEMQNAVKLYSLKINLKQED